jgi:uncharacterized protein YndB with AHSA1/START domain
MPYSYTLSTVIPASPVEIYQAWLDSIAHSEMTGGEAIMSDEVGADVSAWDGYITGRNLELVPGERIVQSWRTTEFEDEHTDSIVTILLRETEDGTLLTLEHSNVPDEYKSYEEGGWQSNYFEPMAVYFSDVKDDLSQSGAVDAPLPAAAPEPAPAARKASRASPRKAPGTKRRAIGSAARRTRPAAGPPKKLKTKPKAAARKAKVGKKAASAAAKKAAKKSSHKTSARRGTAKSAARASARRGRKPARGKRR